MPKKRAEIHVRGRSFSSDIFACYRRALAAEKMHSLSRSSSIATICAGSCSYFFALSGFASSPLPSGRNCGNKITSRIECESVSNMVNRSMPIPSPAVGGMP